MYVVIGSYCKMNYFKILFFFVLNFKLFTAKDLKLEIKQFNTSITSTSALIRIKSLNSAKENKWTLIYYIKRLGKENGEKVSIHLGNKTYLLLCCLLPGTDYEMEIKNKMGEVLKKTNWTTKPPDYTNELLNTKICKVNSLIFKPFEVTTQNIDLEIRLNETPYNDKIDRIYACNQQKSSIRCRTNITDIFVVEGYLARVNLISFNVIGRLPSSHFRPFIWKKKTIKAFDKITIFWTVHNDQKVSSVTIKYKSSDSNATNTIRITENLYEGNFTLDKLESTKCYQVTISSNRIDSQSLSSTAEFCTTGIFVVQKDSSSLEIELPSSYRTNNLVIQVGIRCIVYYNYVPGEVTARNLTAQPPCKATENGTIYHRNNSETFLTQITNLKDSINISLSIFECDSVDCKLLMQKFTSLEPEIKSTNFLDAIIGGTYFYVVSISFLVMSLVAFVTVIFMVTQIARNKKSAFRHKKSFDQQSIPDFVYDDVGNFSIRETDFNNRPSMLWRNSVYEEIGNDYSMFQSLAVEDKLKKECLYEEITDFQVLLGAMTFDQLKSRINQLENQNYFIEIFRILGQHSNWYQDSSGLTMLEGLKIDNVEKNRYDFILPYDQFSVLLSERDSSYINASFIPDNYKRKAYIAAQGPLDKTEEDFWIMLIQQGVSLIVNLSPVQKLIDGELDKYYKYWPELNYSNYYESFKVKTTSEVYHGVFIVRIFQLANERMSHDIIQLHCAEWPDREEPNMSLISDLFMIYKQLREKWSEDLPVIVHDSASIGQTGAFILIDILIEQINKMGNKEIDIDATLLMLRGHRNLMINSPMLYLFVHKFLLFWMSTNNFIDIEECPYEN